MGLGPQLWREDTGSGRRPARRRRHRGRRRVPPAGRV